MSNELVHVAEVSYSREQLDLIKRTFALDATDDEFALFVATAQRLNLNVFAKQVHFVKRKGRAITQIAIDGFRVVAERSGTYEGQTAAQWCGEDGVWRDVWLSSKEPPAAARVGVYRRGWREPLYCVARWGAYAQRDRDGNINQMWSTMGDVMLAKCAEALALRKAFPQDLSGVYTSDEMGQADNPETAPISAPLATYAYSEEEHSRAAKQAPSQAAKDNAIAEAKGMVDAFQSFTHVDEVTEWGPKVVGAWDVLPAKVRSRAYSAMLSHAKSGLVTGMDDGGFAELWEHYTVVHRGELKGDEQS